MEQNKFLAALGVRTLLKMLIDDNFLHADLHPGNILVRLPGGLRGGVRSSEEEGSGGGGGGGGGEEEGGGGGGSGRGSGGGGGGASRNEGALATPEIVILDTGLATELTPWHQAALADFFRCIVSWDGAGVADRLLSFAVRRCRLNTSG